MNARAAHVLDTLRTQLWPLPALAVALAVVMGVALPALDSAVDGELPENVGAFLFSGGPEAARSILQAISGSLITVTSLTFSLTVVTLQLASSQFSPRLLRTFTSDRFVHGTLALFLAAFAFALTVLRTVRDEGSGNTAFVPEISVTVAFALAIASVVGLVLFLAHLAREIRVETMMRRVNLETQETIDRVFADDRPTQGPGPVPASRAVPINSYSSGFLTSVDKDALLRTVTTCGAVVRLDLPPGSSLVVGVPFATAWALDKGTALGEEARETLTQEVNAALATGFERTNVQDVGFGFRQLVDVAVRALSPGINDPTTAVHVIGHLSDLLCRLADKNPGAEHLTDDDGRIRVVLSLPTLRDLLDMAMDQPRKYGAADPAVADRLLGLLHELAWCDPKGQYREEILEHLEQMRIAILAAGYSGPQLRSLLKKADSRGLAQE
jgi:uncharacterized membrane protein